jgi:hypothetical protein
MVPPTNAIFVPKPAKGSYNTNRPAGALLQAQALQFREALLRHLEELSAILAIDPRTLYTEGEISAYVHKATAILHSRATRPAR